MLESGRFQEKEKNCP